MATAKASPSKSKKARKSKPAPAKKKVVVKKKAVAKKKAVVKKKAAARPKRKVAPRPTRARAASIRAAKAKARAAALKKSKSGVLGVAPEYLKAMGLYEKAQVFLEKRDFRRAAELFQRLIDDHAEARDLADRSRIYVSLCHKQTASATKLEGFDDHYYQGVYLTNRGEFGEAIGLFEKALTFRPESGKAHYSLATAYAQVAERQKALEFLRKAVELDEGNRFLARQDPELRPLKGDQEFEDLLGLDEASPAE